MQVLLTAVQQLVEGSEGHKMVDREKIWLIVIMGIVISSKLCLYLYCCTFKSDIVQAYAMVSIYVVGILDQVKLKASSMMFIMKMSHFFFTFLALRHFYQVTLLISFLIYSPDSIPMTETVFPYFENSSHKLNKGSNLSCAFRSNMHISIWLHERLKSIGSLSCFHKFVTLANDYNKSNNNSLAKAREQIPRDSKSDRILVLSLGGQNEDNLLGTHTLPGDYPSRES